jgi:hypothetical protein
VAAPKAAVKAAVKAVAERPATPPARKLSTAGSSSKAAAAAAAAAGVKPKKGKKKKKVVEEEVVEVVVEEPQPSSDEEDVWDDVDTTKLPLQMLILPTTADTCDAQAACDALSRQGEMVRFRLPSRNQQEEMAPAHLQQAGTSLPWAPTDTVFHQMITRRMRKQGLVAKVWVVTARPTFANMDGGPPLNSDAPPHVTPLTEEDGHASYAAMLGRFPFGAAERCLAAAAPLRDMANSAEQRERTQGAHGLWELASFAPNCTALLSEAATLDALQRILMPPSLADATSLRADTLPAVDAAAGAVWVLAASSDTAREALLTHDAMLEALLLLLQRMVSTRLTEEDKEWRGRSARVQLATGALCSLLTNVTGVHRLLNHRLEQLAPKKNALSAAQRKKLNLPGPGLADVDALTPWRVLLACSEQRSDPSLPLTCPPAEELALRALRFALLSPLAPHAQTVRF